MEVIKMSNITITNIDNGDIFFPGAEFDDGLLTFAAEGTVLAGTILAVDSSTLKYVPFVKGGTTNGNGIPKAVISYDVTATAAGDEAVRPGISGKVREDKLIIAADGDGSNVDKAVLDQLRDYSIVSVSVDQLSELDNQ
jgi:hypothetical protein